MTIAFEQWARVLILACTLGLGLQPAGPLLAQSAEPATGAASETTTETPAGAGPEATAGTAPDPTTQTETNAPVLPPPLPPAPAPATPPPLPPQPDYYIDAGGTPGGPYKLAELQALVAAGTLTSGTLAWTDGMAEWAPAAAVTGLETLFAATPAPTAAPAAPGIDVAATLVGNWLQTGPVEIPGVGAGNANLSAHFAADGSFTMGGSIEAINADTGTMTIQLQAEGNYAVQPMADGQFALTQTGSVRMTMPGFAPVDQPIAETANYQMIDANTIEDLATGDRLVRQP